MPVKPNLLFISPLPPRISGATLHSSQLLSGLNKRGYGAYAIAPISPTVPQAQRHCTATEDINIQWLELEDIKLDKRNPSSMDAFGRDVRAVTAALPEAIACIRPSAIVLAFSELTAGIPELAHAHGVPCIVIAHVVVNRVFGGTFRDDIAELLLDEYRKADQVIAVADHVAASVRRCDCDNVASVPNSVDTENFGPGKPAKALHAQLGFSEDDLIVLHVSNMIAVKRPLDIVAAADQSIRQDPRLQFVIAGDGPGLADMRAAADEAGIADRIHFLGTVDPADMPDLYRQADMVLMPSQSEGLSLVYLEALSSGCVLLASDIPASREIVTDDETGFLFPVGDVAAMIELILRNAADAELRERIGRNARAWSLQRPSLDDNIATFADLFDKTIAAHQGRRRRRDVGY